MSLSFLKTDRSFGLRLRVGHGSTRSSPSGCVCPPVSLQRSWSAPLPVTGSWHQDPQLSRRLTQHGPVMRSVVRSQGPSAPAPQPGGDTGQLGKEQALPCAEKIFSQYGVRLGEYDGVSHQ